MNEKTRKLIYGVVIVAGLLAGLIFSLNNHAAENEARGVYFDASGHRIPER